MPYKDYEKQKQNARENYYKNKEKRLQQVRDYYYANWEEKQKQRNEWLKNHKEKAREYQKRGNRKFYENNREQVRAYRKIYEAVKSGKIIKPNECSECNSVITNPRNLHAHHHNGYDTLNVYNIKWLCGNCHRKSHSQLIRG